MELDYMEYANDAAAQAAYMTDSDTKLLIHFDGADGAQAYTAETGQTVTFVADAQLDTAQKKFGLSSLLLDGTGDSTNVPNSDDWYFAQNPFTIDSWVRFNSIAANSTFFAQHEDSTHESTLYWHTDNVLCFYDYSAGFLIQFTCPFTPSTNTWYHIALVRVNSDNAASGWRLFIDGTSQTLTKTQGAWNATLTNHTGTLSIGIRGTSYPLNGWIDEFRVSKGVARWTSNFTPPTTPYPILQCYSENTIKEQGSYSLKGIAMITTSLNKTLTRTVSPTIDLSDLTQIKLDIRGSRTGSNIKIGIHDSGGTTTEHTANVASANTWQTETWDISGVSNANKDAIDSIIITIVNADAANVFYVDNMYGSVMLKALAEAFSVVDSWVAGIAQLEAFSVVDSWVARIAQLEAFLVVDSLVKNGTEQLAEAFSVVDSWTARLNLSEAFSIVDSLVKNGTEQLAEAFSAIDSFVRNGVEQVAEALSVVDTKVTSTKLTFVEALSIVMYNWRKLGCAALAWIAKDNPVTAWIKKD
jgi:hypothetical protein